MRHRPRPAADATNICGFLPDFSLIAHTFEGKERWGHAEGRLEELLRTQAEMRRLWDAEGGGGLEWGLAYRQRRESRIA